MARGRRHDSSDSDSEDDSEDSPSRSPRPSQGQDGDLKKGKALPMRSPSPKLVAHFSLSPTPGSEDRQPKKSTAAESASPTPDLDSAKPRKVSTDLRRGERSPSPSPLSPRDKRGAGRNTRDHDGGRQGASMASRDKHGRPVQPPTVVENGDSKQAAAPAAKPRENNVGKTGGVYIPPFKLARMIKDVNDKSSVEYQRLTWDALRKSINGLVNKVNVSNLKLILPEFFGENLIRGRGLFVRSLMKSQMASPAFTSVYAGLVAVINTKFPELGELVIKRVVLQFRRGFKRNDKPLLLAAVKFIAHLVNQAVAHEILALEVLTVLLETPTEDSVEVAVNFTKEMGAFLMDYAPKALHGVFERFRAVLHEGTIGKRAQFVIEGLFALRKANFEGFPAVPPELDLVEREDQITHEVGLDDEISPETNLDIFHPDPDFLESEKKYEEIKKEILGEESSESEEGDEEEGESEEEDSDEEEQQGAPGMAIEDRTETNLVNLRRTIYLTIMSSVDFEEAGHKLLKIKLAPGQEMELNLMLLECCSQERTYLRYYGLLGERFCHLNKVFITNFEDCFVKQYSMIHRLETNKLRNVAKFFAHLLGTFALPWQVLGYIRLTEEDTTSSSRIFIKILFQELSEHLGLLKLNQTLNDPSMSEHFEGVFPRDSPKNTRFAINFFTSIGLGGLTDGLREHLKNMPKMIMEQQKPPEPESSSEEDESSSGSEDESSSDDSDDSDSSDSSDSETESDSESESESEDDRRKRKKSASKKEARDGKERRKDDERAPSKAEREPTNGKGAGKRGETNGRKRDDPPEDRTTGRDEEEPQRDRVDDIEKERRHRGRSSLDENKREKARDKDERGRERSSPDGRREESGRGGGEEGRKEKRNGRRGDSDDEDRYRKRAREDDQGDRRSRRDRGREKQHRREEERDSKKSRAD